MQIRKFKIQFGVLSIILLAVMAVLIATDLITKACEEAYSWNFTVIPNFIIVESGVRNSGAAFSSFADASWGHTFLVTITFIMLIVLIAVFILLPERFVLLKLAVSMIIAGAIGNLIDRLVFLEVRDFVWVNMLGRFACCNFADFWIVFGVVIAVVDMLFINEWSVFPLTKKSRELQRQRKLNEQKAKEDKPDDGAKED
jgi:signal peptidase II